MQIAPDLNCNSPQFIYIVEENNKKLQSNQGDNFYFPWHNPSAANLSQAINNQQHLEVSINVDRKHKSNQR